MGDPFKEFKDPEKGHGTGDTPRLSILSESISSMFSKAGEGMTSAIATAGEGIHGAGTALKDGAKSAGGVVGLGAKTPPTKKNSTSKRSKQEKKFQKSFRPVLREEPKDTNIVGNITKLLPANTFLMFQTLAPLATNDGNCHRAEIVMTSAMLIILMGTCMLVCFTDTVQFNGKVYHGLVTPGGLWNPSFKGDPSFADLRQYEHQMADYYEARRRYKMEKDQAKEDKLPVPPRPEEPLKPRGPHIKGSTFSSGTTQYQLNATDFLHAILSAMAFGTLTMLTNPVSTCFYPDIPSTVVKTLPLLVGFVISAIFAFSPPARNGIAHPLSPKAASQMDNYKPPDPKGMVHGPMLPPKPASKGGKPKPDDDDDDDLGGSVKKYLGKFFGSPDHEKSRDAPATDQHDAMDGVKGLARGFFNRYGDDLKEGAAKMVHSLGDDVKKEASHLLHKASPHVDKHSKDIHVPLALQEAAKSVPHDEFLARLVNAGAHPALALAALQYAARGAEDAALKDIHQGLQTAASMPLGLSKQSSMALTRANSMLQSAGSSLTLPAAHDAHDALFHQAAQVLQRQVSGLPPNVHTAGPEAAAIALATGQALLQAGYQLPDGGQSPQAMALSAYSQGMQNFNLNAAGALVKDASALVQQGSKSFTEMQDVLAQQGAAFSQGFKSSSFSFPASLISSDSQMLNQVAHGTMAATLAGGAAREASSLLQEGADHGMAGVHAEIARQKAVAMQPVTSLAQQGSKTLDNALIQEEVLMQEMNSQARALSTPATSVARDIAALSQPTVSSVNSQFVESLARGVAAGMSTRMAQAQAQAQFQQPAASVAIDVSSLLQHQASQMRRQASALSPQALAATAAMLQHQASLGHFQQPSAQQVAATHLALHQFASQLSPRPPSPELAASLSSPIIEEVTEAGQRGVERLQQLPSVTEELVARAPSASQVRAASSEVAANASQAAGQAALASVTRILRSDRPEPTEITDTISAEEITSDSETEPSNRGTLRPGSSSFNFQTRKL